MADGIQLQIDQQPRPEGEAAGFFENKDETKHRLNIGLEHKKHDNAHNLEKLKLELGWLGKFAGSKDANNNLIFLILIFCLTCIIPVLIAMWWEFDTYLQALGILLSPVTTIIGYLMGSKK